MSRDDIAREGPVPDSRGASERERVAFEIDEEIAFHLDSRARALEDAGLSAREARLTALARFGDRRRIRRACLVQRNWRSIMLQRIHLATTLLLLIGAALLGARSLSAEAAYETRLAELCEAVARLQAPPTLEQEPESTSVPLRDEFTTIAVGDVLHLVDQTHTDFQVTATVCRDGMILLPDVGWYMAAGKWLETIDAELNEAFAEFHATPPSIVTMLKEAAPIRTAPTARVSVTTGDTLRILDEAHPIEVNFTVTVGPDGTILLPELGRFHVAGFTRNDLESILTERYAPLRIGPPVIRVLVSKAP